MSEEVESAGEEGPLRVLVLDDETVSRTLVAALVRAGGFEALEAASTVEALQLVAEETVDVVVVDQIMEPYSGLAFIRAVRTEKEFNDMRLIMLTGTSEPGTVQAAMRSGADAFLVKPVTEEILVNRIKTVLEYDEPGALNPANKK